MSKYTLCEGCHRVSLQVENSQIHTWIPRSAYGTESIVGRTECERLSWDHERVEHLSGIWFEHFPNIKGYTLTHTHTHKHSQSLISATVNVDSKRVELSWVTFCSFCIMQNEYFSYICLWTFAFITVNTYFIFYSFINICLISIWSWPHVCMYICKWSCLKSHSLCVSNADNKRVELILVEWQFCFFFTLH